MALQRTYGGQVDCTRVRLEPVKSNGRSRYPSRSVSLTLNCSQAFHGTTSAHGAKSL